ncbi:hypothetical protein CTAYLR_010792 [Chrysophaeum taylorii]|uniref:Protein kinase domain-containing protein n=1 Tax=Chrysophaeum taylorii TaxID=2483200 RepID=A0AAD7UK56_9STRA|nr:hypothetical protein CTAYLR_010792 [Chrysophaeum taylorii]
MKCVSSDKLRGASGAARNHNIEEEIRLCREALLMAEPGTHPHIVSLHYCAVSSSNAEFLLFMTLVDGARDLERLVSSGDLHDDGDARVVRASIVSILPQLASALAFCHSRGVLHQDVKLENILVDTEGRAYLGDFGLARHGDGVGTLLRAPLEGCTPTYASPEVVAALDISSGRARGVARSVSPAETDIWAFGVVTLLLYHADEEPFPGLRTALESIGSLECPAAANGGDVAECCSLIACAHLRAGSCEEAPLACDRALSHDAEHGGVLFAKAEATYRHNSSDSLFVDVVHQARLYDAKLFPAPRAEKGAVACLEAAKDDADSAYDPVTNDRVSVSEYRVSGGAAVRSTTADYYSSVRGALADVVHTGEAVEAAMRTGHVVIEGDAGSGKGWILRAVVVAPCNKQLHSASGESSESELMLPMTISLSSIDDPESDWVGRVINDVRDGSDALRPARIDGRLPLCLDGLDEVAPTTRPSLVEKIVEYAQGCALTVITSRPAARNIDDLAPHGFTFLSIAQVDRGRVETLTGITPDIASLVETPLALRLALLALSPTGGLQTPSVLRDRSDLFRIADDRFMARAVAPMRQDGTLTLARDVLQECGSSEVREVFERLALVAHQDRRTLFQRGDIEGLGSPRLAAAV